MTSEATNRDEEPGAPCDACGRPTSEELGRYTDEEACGNGDGPGFFLCHRGDCPREAWGGLPVGERRRLYAAQRATNRAAEAPRPGVLPMGGSALARISELIDEMEDAADLADGELGLIGGRTVREFASKLRAAYNDGLIEGAVPGRDP